jgi:histidinol-phosphate aminotransferase
MGELGLPPLPSDANFVLVPVPVPTVDRLVAALDADHISVRRFTALRGIGDALRITIGPWPVMERVLRVVEQSTARSAES